MFTHNRALRAGMLLVLLVTINGLAQNVTTALAAGQSFTSLQSGLTQSLYGVYPAFMGGVAFAPNGDVWVATNGAGAPLIKFSQNATYSQNGSTLHAVSTAGGPYGYGITNHPNGFIYQNTDFGVVKRDATTGAVVAGPYGPPGNHLGIATDPQTGNLVYADFSDDAIDWVSPAFDSSGQFANTTALGGSLEDGIYFDPSGNYLFVAYYNGSVVVIRRDGSIVQSISDVPHQPDGMAFHAGNALSGPYLMSNNTDGTVTRYDFPGNDYSQTPTLTSFAAGGFRGDMAGVGPDECVYLTQIQTRYDDGTVDPGNNSLVRVCPNFAPGPGVTPTFIVPAFVAPLSSDTSGLVANTGKAGRTYPVKFQLTDRNGTSISDPSVFQSIASVPCPANTGPAAASDAIDFATTASAGLHYDSTANQWVYNYKTPSTPGCYLLTFTLTDSQTFMARFVLS
jgi:hypothetical protein